MSVFHFTLIVEGPDLQDEARIGALFEAGCDDAAVGQSDGVQFVDFDREAGTLDGAILSAVDDLGRGWMVSKSVRIADAGLASLADIAARLGRTRESVRLLVKGARGPGGFPKPVTDPRSRYRLWRWSDVERWFTERLGEVLPLSQDEVVATFSVALELRRLRRSLSLASPITLRELVGIDVPQASPDQ